MPVIKGTRVPVDLILSKLAAGGMAYEEVMSEYDLTKEDILAALDYRGEDSIIDFCCHSINH